jgi:hypothetical protein
MLTPLARRTLLGCALIVAACDDAAAPGGGPDTTGTSYDLSTLASGIQFVPPQFTTGQPEQAHLEFDGASLYWTEGTESAVRAVPVAGGSATTVARRFGVPIGLRVAGEYLYWIDARTGFAPSGCAGDGAYAYLRRVRIDGTSDPATLALGDRCAGGATDLVVDASDVYWVTSTGSPNTYTIRRVPLSGGAGAPLVTAAPFFEITALAADADHIYWQEYLDSSQVKRVPKGGGAVEVVASGARAPRGGLVVGGGFVYFADTDFFDEHRVLRAPAGGGAAQVLAPILGVDQSGARVPRSIVVAASNVYWADSGAIHAVPTDSGAVATPVPGLTSPVSLAVSATELFWLESVCCAHGQTGTLTRAPLAGGAGTVVASGLAAPTTLAVDGANAFWAEGGPLAFTEGFGRIAATPTGGGAITTVASGVAGDFPVIAVHGGHVFIGDRFTVKTVPVGGGPVERLAIGDFLIEDIATDGAHVYWIEDGFTAIRRAPTDGGAVTTLASAPGPAGPLVVNGSYVYWIDNFANISRVPAAGGASTPLASGLPFLSDLVVAGTDLYFSEHDMARIRRMPVGGGAIAPFASESPLASPHLLAVDATNVYWINQGRVAAQPRTGSEETITVDTLTGDPYFPAAITASNGTIYWTDVVGGRIRRAVPATARLGRAQRGLPE